MPRTVSHDSQITEQIRLPQTARTAPRTRRRRVPALAVALILLAAGVVAYLNRPRAPVDLIGDRSQFASGACAVYSPMGHDRHTTVFLDPGHGGPDPGGAGATSSGSPLQEKNLTLAVAMRTLTLLRGDGYRVAISRTTDSPVGRLGAGALQGGLYTPQGVHADVAARVACANDAHAQLLLAIHFNSYDDPSVGGVETYYDPDRPFAAKNLRFAQFVQQDVLASLQAHGWTVPDRSVIADSDLSAPTLTTRASSYGHLLELGPAAPGWFDNPSSMSGALSEPLFLTDSGEADVVATPQGRQALAEAYATAINQYFSRPR